MGSTARFATGLVVRGLQWSSGSGNRVLFLDRKVTSGLPAALSGSEVVYRLVRQNPVSGATHSVSVRDPMGQASTPLVRVFDDSTGSFARIFAPDPARQYTTRWQVVNPSGIDIAPGTTTLRFSGSASPEDGQVVWIGKEALAIDGPPTAVGDNTWEATVVRAQCGSRALTHALDPYAYPGDDGLAERITAYSRPPWDEVRFEAQIWHFKLSDFDPEAIASTEWIWNGFVSARPTVDDKLIWSIPVTHVSKILSDKVQPKIKDLELTRRVRVTELNNYTPTTQGNVGAGSWPLSASLYLTCYEAERLFGKVLHKPDLKDVDSSEISTLNTRLHRDSRVYYEAVVNAGGYDWAFRIVNVYYDTVTESAKVKKFARVDLALTEDGHAFSASIQDSPASYPPSSAAEYLDEPLNAGWSNQNTAVRTDYGEAPPKVTLRPRLEMSFIDAFLTLALSGHGGGINDSTYDILVGCRGCEIDPTWLNTGSVAGTPSEATSALLELNQLLSEVYTYALQPGDKLRDWGNNELLLHTSLLGFVDSTGALAIRMWARDKGSPSALTTIGPNQAKVKTSGRLEELKAIRFLRGIYPLDLKPRAEKTVRIAGANAEDVEKAQPVRVWKDGGSLSDAPIATGPLAKLEFAFLSTLEGAPPVYEVELSVETAVTFADIVLWTEARIPTPAGFGVTDKGFIVVGVDRDLTQGRKAIRLLQDAINDFTVAAASTGRLPPSLNVDLVHDLKSSTRIEVVVTSLGESSFAITTSHQGIWQTLANAEGRVRVVLPTAHNPTGTTEREGALELSAKVKGIYYDGKRGLSRIDLEANSAWARGGYAIKDIIIEGATIHLSDFRDATSNPEGALIAPPAEQLYDGGSGADFFKMAGSLKGPSFDSRYSKLGA